MVLMGFKNKFVEDIESGKKVITIRRLRKKGQVKVGENIFAYMGLRTKKCERLVLPSPVVRYVIPILFKKGDTLEVGLGYSSRFFIKNKYLFIIAKNDGFENLDSFFDFHFRDMQKGDMVKAVLIGWGEENKFYQDMMDCLIRISNVVEAKSL